MLKGSSPSALTNASASAAQQHVATAWLLATLLFGVDARDPAVFSGAAVFLMVVAIVRS